jgi:hypothetical protein
MAAPSTGTLTWQNALEYADDRNAANLCGYSDWRLPNIHELESLIHLGHKSGSASWLTLPDNGFAGIDPYNYWSSTTASSATGKAWVIDFDDNGRDMADKSQSYYALPVCGDTTGSPAEVWRTGQTGCYNESGDSISCAGTGQDGEIRAGLLWPAQRFTDLGNGTVRDNLTGLIWTANANTPGPAVCSPGSGKIIYDAYFYIQCLNDTMYLGYTDWRMPNRKELESLIDHSTFSPALPQGHPFGVVSGYYWTSDTNVDLCSMGWAVDMNAGLAIVLYKNVDTNTLSLWPVRGPLALKVLFAGDGQGNVEGGQISCSGNRCLGIYCLGEEVTLTAKSASDSVFVGWTGCPSPSGNQCTIPMDADSTMIATFLESKSIWDKPGSINFGKVGVGVISGQRYVSVKNRYGTDLHIDTVEINGANALEFTPVENCSGVTLPPGESCSIILSVTAQGYGTRSAELDVTFSGAVDTHARMKLKAKAMPAKIYVNPRSLRFDKVSTAGSTEQQLTVENRGLTPLSISTAPPTGDHGADFTFDPPGCPILQEGQACVLTITFRPGGIGKRTGALVITSDAPKKGMVTVKLKGEGT